MVNYPGDVECEEDYELGWEWFETDPDFFNALFENWMYTIMVEQTNLYARQQTQGKFTILSSQNR